MKKCFRCGSPWNGIGAPRPREVCEGCGAYLHACVNCHHFDRERTNSCTLENTTFVGSRDSLNYCEEFHMLDSFRRAREQKVVRAKAVWEDLFRP